MTELPKGWALTTLDNLAEWGSGGTPSRKNSGYFGGNIPWIKTGELGPMFIHDAEEFITEKGLSESSAKVFPKGSVGIAMYGATIGKVSIWGIDAATNQACAVARPFFDITSSKFIYYFLASVKRDLVRAGKGGAQPNISQGLIRDWPLALPPLPEQHRIVAKIEALFSELDAGQDSLTRAQAQLKLYRQSLLKAAFQGRLTADWRKANPDKLEPPETLLARIRLERDARYKQALDNWQTALTDWRAGGEVGRKPAKPKRPDWPEDQDFSDLEPLPHGWAYCAFQGLAYAIRNGISKKPDETGDLKIFRISAVRPMFFDMTDFRHLKASPEFEEFRLRAGDLVFTRYNGSRAYVGVAAIYRGDGSHVYPDKLIRCDVGSAALDPDFLEKAVNCGEPRAFIEKRIRTTAGQAGISGGDLKAMPVPVCSPGEQAELNAILDAKLSQINAMDAEITTALAKLSALRQSILKKAFSGQLVPQDPADEPAAALLSRLRDAAPKEKPRRKVRA